MSKALCSLVADCGFNFTHVAPVFQNFAVNYAVKRIDSGGKALTNYLKELVSYRATKVMDELSLWMMLRKSCALSRSTSCVIFISPGIVGMTMFCVAHMSFLMVSHTKGFVKDPNTARRYLSASNGSLSQPSETEKDLGQTEVMAEDRDRKGVDLTKNQNVNSWKHVTSSIC